MRTIQRASSRPPKRPYRTCPSIPPYYLHDHAILYSRSLPPALPTFSYSDENVPPLREIRFPVKPLLPPVPRECSTMHRRHLRRRNSAIPRTLPSEMRIPVPRAPIPRHLPPGISPGTPSGIPRGEAHTPCRATAWPSPCKLPHRESAHGMHYS